MTMWEHFANSGPLTSLMLVVGMGLGWWMHTVYGNIRKPAHRAAVRPSKPVEVRDDPTYQLAPKTASLPLPVEPRTVTVPMAVTIVSVPAADIEPGTINLYNEDGKVVFKYTEVDATYKAPAPGRHRAVVTTNPIRIIESEPIVLGQPKRGRHAL